MNYVSEFYCEKEPLRRLVIGLLPKNGGLTLDLGCKTGDISREIEKLSNDLIAIDRESHEEWASSSIAFIQADAVDIPLSENTFKMVVSMEMLQYVEDWPKVLHEIHRILVSDGQLLLSFPEGGFCSVCLDPFRLSQKLKSLFFPRKEDAFVRNLKLNKVLKFCEDHWKVEKIYRRGSMFYIYLAWLIDYFHTLEKMILNSRIPAKKLQSGLIKNINYLFMALMKLDFTLSWGKLSYNNVVLLRKK